MVNAIVMLGESLNGCGAIAETVNAYRAQGLFRRWPVQYIATHGDAHGAPRKTAEAIKAMTRVFLAVVRERRTLVHLHSASPAGVWRDGWFAAIALAARCPVVFHFHAGNFARFYDSRCSRPTREAIRFALERSASIVVPTEPLRRWMGALCCHSRIVCIPSPVNEVALVPGAGRHNMVLYIGPLERSTGLYELLEAVSALRLRLPEVTLVCAGEGDADPARRVCERLGIADAVTFTGRPGDEERRALLQRAAVFVLPCQADAAPMSLLEAMSARVPIIAAEGGGVQDVLVHGVSALLYQNGQPGELHRLLGRVLHDPALGARLAAEARSTVVSRYGADRVIAQLGALYASLGVKRAHDDAATPRIPASQEAA